MRGIMFQGLSEPADTTFRTRMKRFAGLYMNEDPSAPNYDPKHKIIRSIWNGSKGPMMHKATTYDWVGDPVPGMFHILHGPHGRNKLVDLMSVYHKMLSHCAEYLDSVGDHPLNLGATNLALRAYMLTHEDKYRDWALEYVNAWKGWVAEAGGMIPTNIGLNGKIGGEYDGQWWKGTYGWNFTIYDGEIDQIAHRNTVTSGSWPGFSNAFLLTGDHAYVDVLRKQLDLIYAQKKIVDGKEVYPSMYGDPRHHTKNGKPEWYRFGSKPHLGRATEVYLWSMNATIWSMSPWTAGSDFWRVTIPIIRNRRSSVTSKQSGGSSGGLMRTTPLPTRGCPTICSVSLRADGYVDELDARRLFRG